MKRLLFSFALALTALVAVANEQTEVVPSNWGDWKNLSMDVNDITYYDSNQLPMQTAVSGKTIHVAWADWKADADGNLCVYYRRSADGGQTWDDARVVVASPDLAMVDINYVGGSFGTNAKWMEVDGDHVYFATVFKSAENGNSQLVFTYSNDGGKSFEKRVLAEADHGYGRPHVVSDGQTVVVAFQESLSEGYFTHVLTSFDGGATFKGNLIEKEQDLVDVKVSGKRWTVLGNDMYWSQNMWWGNVYLSTSTDGGETISTQNIAPLVKDDTSWCSLEYMKGFNGASFNYHPQMTLEGDVINVIFKGCAVEVEDVSPTNDRAHTIFRRSTDGGETWTDAMYLPESTGTEGAIAAKGNHIYVLQTPNGPLMYHSHDGGKTWDIQRRCYWDGRSDGYSNFYELYIAPDDQTGQHVYMTGARALLVETKDGFRSIHRNFALGTESWYGGRANNHSLTVQLDSEGTEHWVMNYQAPYESNDYFWNIVYRRNDLAPATGSTNMALDISKLEDQVLDKPLTNVTVPMTPSILGTKDATTVECWVRVDKPDYSTEIASLTNKTPNHKGSYYVGGWYINLEVDNGWYSFSAGVTTEQSVDGTGKQIWDRWRYQIKDAGLWHHVVLTYDSNVKDNNFRFYVDGLLMGTATEQGPLLIGNNPMVIGRTSTYGENKVLVDNFAVFDRAISQEEVLEHLYNAPTGKEDNCCLLLTFDGSLQDKSQYHNDPAPLMDAVLAEHDGIRAPHPEFTLTKSVNGQTVYANDMTQDGEGIWWILPYPGDVNNYKTSENRYESQDFSRDPGTYQYTLIAKGTGDCNAYASASQTITIGGLSKVEPAVAGQDAGVRLTILGGYNLTYNNKPEVLLHKDGTVIEGEWMVEYGYDSKNVQSPDDMAKALFDLSDAAPGVYDVVVANDTLYNAFTIEKFEEPKVWMEVTGWDRQLWNKWKDFYIVYGNTSNVPAYNVPIFLMFSDKRGKVDVSFGFDYDLCNPALSDYGLEVAQQLGDHLMAYDETLGDSIQVYSFMIPYIAPKSKAERKFRMRHRNDEFKESTARATTRDRAYPAYDPELFKQDDVDIIYWAEAPWGAMDPDAPNPYDKGGTRVYSLEQGECFAGKLGKALLETAIGFVPGLNCGYAITKGFYQSATEVEKPWSSFASNYISTLFSCCEDLIPGGGLWNAAFTLGSLAWGFYSGGDEMGSCLNGDPKKFKVRGVGSYDPNEMIGPAGYDDEAHYIKPINNMGYTITYENKSSATAPAHEVYVNDKLDLSKYDAESFAFTSFGWADTTVYVGGATTQEFTRDIKYQVNEQDIIVRVSGSFDPETGVANWSMISLDKSGKEIEDPDLGYLLPNNDDHVGEGFVSFSIKHKDNPANGTKISNKATIIFDANAPIETNVYTNTIDTDYPTSKITKSAVNGGIMELTIEGSDATSGVASYDVYVFKDGGEAEAVVYGLPEGSKCTIPYEASIEYAFCVIATDNVGWKEPKDIKAEYTHVSAKQSITISAAKQVPYCSDKNLDFTSMPDLKAYVATGYDKSTGTIWLTRVKQVPAETGFLLIGDPGDYEIPVVDGISDCYYMNMFKGTLTGTTIQTTEGDYTNYYLSNGTSGVGFYKVTNADGQKIGANRCYLPILTDIPAEGSEGDAEVIKVSAAKQVPYFTSKNIDFTTLDAQGVKAYTATGYNYGTGVIWLTRVKKVPAKTGILVMANEAGEYSVPTTSVQSVYENMFRGSLTAQTIYTTETVGSVDYVNYYLSNGESGVGFYKVTKEDGVSMGANRCYLPIPYRAPSGTRVMFSEDTPTWYNTIPSDDVITIHLLEGEGGISELIEAEKPVFYNLQGQRVENPRKGLYILNGKIVLIK